MPETTNIQTLRLAVIGGGTNSAVGHVHFSASQLDGNCRVVAGSFSKDPDINRQTGERWSVDPSRIYASWTDLVQAERQRVDAVVILTPTPMHTEMVIACLSAGLAVICEKALAMNLKELTDIRTCLQTTKGFLAVTYNYSAYPMVRELRERVRLGELGTIQQIQLEMPQEGFVRPPDIAGQAKPPQAWRLSDGEIPTIGLDLGVHLCHLGEFLTGQTIHQVQSDMGTFSSFGVIDYWSILTRYQGGARGSIYMTKTAIGCRNGLKVRLFGSLGGAEWYQAQPDELALSYADGRRIVIDRGCPGHVIRLARYNRMKAGHPAGFIEAFANLYNDFRESLLLRRDGRTPDDPYVPGIDASESGLRILAASAKAAQSGNWTKV